MFWRVPITIKIPHFGEEEEEEEFLKERKKERRISNGFGNLVWFVYPPTTYI